MLKTYFIGGLVALGISPLGASADEALDRIKGNKAVAIGIKVDYRPFGFRDQSGDMKGMEHDLSALIGARLEKKLGVPIEVQKVITTSPNRIPFVQQGKIDLVIATMNDSEERRRVVDIIDPGYYASGAQILARSDRKLKAWEDLAGKNVCIVNGSFYLKPLAEKYKIEFMPFAGVSEMNQALLDDRCFAQVTDSVYAQVQLQDKSKWGAYTVVAEPEFVTPYVIAIKQGNPDLRALLSELVKEWHKSGILIDLEKKWGLEPNNWLAQQKLTN